MAHPQIAVGGDTLQFWRAAANILNKQSWTADKGGPPDWGLGMGLTTHRKKISLLRTFKRGLRPGRIPWINDLSEPKREEVTGGWRKLHSLKNKPSEESA
jgi:hypothetical protein